MIPRFLCIAVSLVLTSCIIPEPLKEHREIARNALLTDEEVAKPYYLETDEFRMHYRKVGTPKKGVVVWVHGTPGSWDDGIRLMVDKHFVSDVEIVGIDRPGWGRSQYLDNPRIVSSFEDQGKFISPVLRKLREENPNVPLIVVGHSWGASLVPSIALSYPELMDGIVVAAGGIDPELTSPRWYNRFASTWIVDRFLDERMRAANVEVYALQDQLKERESQWRELSVPVIAIQGAEDRLVDPRNLEFIKENFPDPYVLMLEDQGHLLQAERIELIGRCIKAMLNQDFADCRE